MIPVNSLKPSDHFSAAMLQLWYCKKGTDTMPLLGKAIEDVSEVTGPSKATEFTESMERAYFAALRRDVQYARASRGLLTGLGANGTMRTHYEIARIAELGGIE